MGYADLHTGLDDQFFPFLFKVALSCLTLCDPMDYTVHGILQTRILEWVTFPFSRGSSQPRSPSLQADSHFLRKSEQSKHEGDGVKSKNHQSRFFAACICMCMPTDHPKLLCSFHTLNFLTRYILGYPPKAGFLPVLYCSDILNK